ncbi:Tkp3 protein, partial [Vanderwaltozyma polyspora DSM 70294]
MEASIKALQESIEALNAKMDERQQEDLAYRAKIQQSFEAMNTMNTDLATKLLELKTKDDEERKVLKEASIEFTKFQKEQEEIKKEAKELGVELKEERKHAEAILKMEEQALQAKFEEEDKNLENLRDGIAEEVPKYLQEFRGEIINQVNNLIAEQDNPTQGKINNNEKLQKEKILLSKIKKHSSSIIIDEDNQIILECTKRFTDANLTPIDTDEVVALSPVFPIQQSKDKIRIITDLRKVNTHLLYTPRPIPPIQHIFSNLANKTIFSSLDIRKAYQQIPIQGDKLGLITELGSYKFNRLPYGLASAPYWWGEFIQNILKQLPQSKDTIVSYYYDDLIIASSTIAEHYTTLKHIMALLAENGLSLSYEKIHIAQPKVLFLGYEVSHNRLAIDKEKKNTIARWVLPEDKKAIEKFTGFVNFLRNFIQNASQILAPFYSFATNKPSNHEKTILQKAMKK